MDLIRIAREFGISKSDVQRALAGTRKPNVELNGEGGAWSGKSQLKQFPAYLNVGFPAGSE